MTIINQKTKEATTINDKNSSYIKALLHTCHFEDCTYIVSTEDILLYGVTPDEYNIEEALDHVYHVKLNEEKATAGTPEATKKPTVQEELTKANDILEKRIDILHTRLAKVAEHFLTEQVQDVIYETHKQEDFREAIEATYAKVSDLWHTLDDDQRDKMSDILHGLGVSTGMLLSEVYKAGIKTCNTHGETLESLNNFEAVDVSKVFYDALPTDRY